MLSHYLDILAIPQVDILQSDVMGKIMEEVHLALPHYEGRIGLAFPAYGQQRTLGGIMRLLGSKEDIKSLQQRLISKPNLQDYAVLKSIGSVPSKIKGYYAFARYHPKGQSDLRRAQHRLSAQGMGAEEINRRLDAKAAKEFKINPHLKFRSLSTGQQMYLAIQRIWHDHAQEGKFSSYGLSREATVPDF